VLCFAETDDGIRVISLRKADDREVKRYGRERPASSLTDEDGEVRELQDEDFVRARRFGQLPAIMQRSPRGVRGTQKAPTKALISMRVSRDVLVRFRAPGEGWQTRMDEALREWIERPTRERQAIRRSRALGLPSSPVLFQPRDGTRRHSSGVIFAAFRRHDQKILSLRKQGLDLFT